MAIFSLEIPDDMLAMTYEAVCAEGAYSPDSGLTPAEFTRAYVINDLKQIVTRYHVSQAAAEAQTVAEATVAAAREEIQELLAVIV